MATAVAVLDAQLRAAGIPIVSVRLAGGALAVVYDPSATQAQRDQGDALAASAGTTDRKPRTLYAIRADLVALTGTQKAAVWSALTAGTPPLWATDAGPNAAALAALQMFGASATLSAADILEAKIRAAAFFAQDNPRWLVNPAFDSTINVPGDQPV